MYNCVLRTYRGPPPMVDSTVLRISLPKAIDGCYPKVMRGTTLGNGRKVYELVTPKAIASLVVGPPVKVRVACKRCARGTNSRDKERYWGWETCGMGSRGSIMFQ